MKIITIPWDYSWWGRTWESMFSKLYLWQIRLERVEKSHLRQTSKQNTRLERFKKRPMTERDSRETWKTVLADQKCRICWSLRRFTITFPRADNRFQRAGGGGEWTESREEEGAKWMNKERKKNREYQHVLHNQFLKNVSANTRPASVGKQLAKLLWVREAGALNSTCISTQV